MEEKSIKISLLTFFLIITLIIIAVMAFFMYKIYNDKNTESKKVTELQAQISNLNKTVNNYQEKINTDDKKQTNAVNTSDVKYEISIKDEIYAIIKATKDGKTITKEFKMDSVISDTGTMILPTIGSVALVADSGGEYYGVTVYQLINGNIEKIGTINCGSDMVKDTTYEVSIKDEINAIITANRNGEITKKEFKMDAAIAKTEVVDILKCGKVVLVAESAGENYTFMVFRLSQNDTIGKTKEIIEAGTISFIN